MYIRLNSNRYKTLLVFILSFSLYFNGFSQAYAGSVGDWTLDSGVAQGASRIYEGTKQVIIDGKNYVKKGTAKITPVAADVSKVLVRGAGGLALTVAVEQLLGAVDWVLDPANNQIVYTVPSTDPLSPTNQYYYLSSAFGVNKYFTTNDSAAEDTCKRNAAGYGWIYVSSVPATFTSTQTGSKNATCTIKRSSASSNEEFSWPYQKVLNPSYNPAAEKDKKSISLDAVSDKIIANANAGDAAAQAVTGTAADDIVNDKTKAPPIIAQLENTAKTELANPAEQEAANDAKGEAKPNETGGTDLALEFPAFCGWAPVVCEAAQVAISFPNTVAEWWNYSKTKSEEWATAISQSWSETKDWAKAEPETPVPETPPEIPDAAVDISVTNYIQGTAYCPADRHVPLAMGGNSLDLVISYQPLCTVAQQFRPAVILMAFLAGAFIITNTGRRAETGD